MTRRRPRGQRGQAAVIVALAGMAFMAIAGLALDAGFEVGKYRTAQNASDAAALSVANVVFQAAVRHQVAPTTAQLEANADGVITRNRAQPGRFNGGGIAVTPVAPSIPVFAPGAAVRADSALASYSVHNQASVPPLTTRSVAVGGHVGDSLINARLPGVGIAAAALVQADTADVNATALDIGGGAGIPISASYSVSCFQNSVGGSAAACPSDPLATLTSTVLPLTVSNVAAVNNQSVPAPSTDSDGNPSASVVDDISSVTSQTVGALEVDAANATTSSTLGSGSVRAAAALDTPTVRVTTPVGLFNLTLTGASITDSISDGNYSQVVTCQAGATFTVSPTDLGSPVVIPVGADCSVPISAPVASRLAALGIGLTVGPSPSLSDACPNDGVTVCSVGGCDERVQVSYPAASPTLAVDVCLGSASASATLTTSARLGTSRVTSITVQSYVDTPTFFLRVLGLTHTDPAASATTSLLRVSDVNDTYFTASSFAMPEMAVPVGGTVAEHLTVGHQYYVWGPGMSASSDNRWMEITAGNNWRGSVSAAPGHGVGSRLTGRSGTPASAPRPYVTGGYVLLPVIDQTGFVVWYAEFVMDTSNGHLGTLVNSDPTHSGHLVQAPGSQPWSPLSDGAVTIKLTN